MGGKDCAFGGGGERGRRNREECKSDMVVTCLLLTEILPESISCREEATNLAT